MEKSLIERVRESLERELNPVSLDISDNSHNHLSGNSETRAHFCIVIQSELFNTKTLVQQHQMIYKALEEELQNGIHALSIETKKTA